MNLRISVDQNLQTKVPSEAVRDFFERFRGGARVTPVTRLMVRLSTRRYSDAIAALAARLPDHADGFSLGSTGKHLRRADIAAQLAERNNLQNASFEGYLTDYMDFDAATTLVSSLLDLRPGALRSTSFHIRLEGFDFLGGEALGGTLLSLSDERGLGRKVRFQISAAVDCQGDGPKDRAVREQLASLERSTGIPFGRAQVRVNPLTVDPEDEATYSRLVAFHWCVQHAFAIAAHDMRASGRQWQSIPGLRTEDAAWERRFAAVLRGRSRRIEFNGVVKRFIRATFPKLTFKARRGDCLEFMTPLVGATALLVQIERIHGSGVGKMFTLNYVVRVREGPLAGHEVRESAFAAFGLAAHAVCWAYVTQDDLHRCLAGLKSAIEVTLPPLCRHIEDRLQSLPDTAESVLEVRPAVTAKTLWPLIKARAIRWAPDARFIRLTAINLPLPYRSRIPWAVRCDGALDRIGTFVYRFDSISTDSELDIRVPYAGAISEFHSPRMVQPTTLDVSSDAAGSDDWMDSNAVMRLALAACSDEQRGDVEASDRMTIKLERSEAHNWAWRWTLTFSRRLPEANRHISISFDARTGEDVTIQS